jgi:hypothetical protein
MAQERKWVFRFGSSALDQSSFQQLDFASDYFGNKGQLRTTVSGWALTGSRADAYEVRCDEIFSDCAIAVLRSRSGTTGPFGMGSLTHTEQASRWRGMRLKLRAELKAGSVDGWAGLWMRVDGPGGRPLAFDNMQNRPLRGTTGFDWHTVVLDVPEAAERVSFGVLVHGPGAVLVKDLELEAVDDTVPTTDLMEPLRAQAVAH